jgi:hypothetical protein
MTSPPSVDGSSEADKGDEEGEAEAVVERRRDEEGGADPAGDGALGVAGEVVGDDRTGLRGVLGGKEYLWGCGSELKRGGHERRARCR